MTETTPLNDRYRFGTPARWLTSAGGALFVLVVAIGGYYIGRQAERQQERRAAAKVARLPSLQGQLADALQSQIRKIESQLQAISKEQPPQDHAARINGLHQQIRNVQTNLSALQGQLGSLQKQLDQITPSNQRATIDALTARLKIVQDKLSEMMPSRDTPDTYSIKTNEAVTVAGGRLHIGIVDSPRQEMVLLNLNGEHRWVAAGDIINTATNCSISVVSIDVLKGTALVKATCTPTKS